MNDDLAEKTFSRGRDDHFPVVENMRGAGRGGLLKSFFISCEEVNHFVLSYPKKWGGAGPARARRRDQENTPLADVRRWFMTVQLDRRQQIPSGAGGIHIELSFAKCLMQRGAELLIRPKPHL